MIEENECMVNEFQLAEKREEQSTGSAKAEMEMAILAEVLILQIVTWRLYDRFVTMDKEVVHLHQQCYTKITGTLTSIYVVVDHIQTWKMRYKGAPLHLQKMMKT